MPKRCVGIACVALVLGSQAFCAGPSENKGRRGMYECRTTRPLYTYFVYVPSTYSAQNPAGIHLYFHGQGCQDSASTLMKIWAKHVLEPQNLIGIDMRFMDGNNYADIEGKIASAMEAVQQTMADYKVIRGRGVIASHSSGISPHVILIRKFGERGAPPGSWPFIHSAAYGGYLAEGVEDTVGMSWFLSVATIEWNEGNIGNFQLERGARLFAETSRGRCPDVYFKIIKGQAHWKIINGEGRWIDERDVVESTKGFARSDLAFCPFLYEPDYPSPELAPIVKAANRLELGKANAELERLLNDTNFSGGARIDAELLKRKIDSRVDAVLALAGDLSANDPMLWGYYCRIFAAQLRDHPREADFKQIPLPTARQQKDADWALSVFAQHFKEFFGPIGGVRKEAVDTLKAVRERAGPGSTLGMMANEYLQLQ